MSPGKRPSQPLPMPDHNNAPTAASNSPAITRNLPNSFTFPKWRAEHAKATKEFLTPIPRIDTNCTRSVLECGDMSPL